MAQVRQELDTWVDRVSAGATEDEFVEAARRDLYDTSDWNAPYYERAAPFWQSYAGLRRWWVKQQRLATESKGQTPATSCPAASSGDTPGV